MLIPRVDLSALFPQRAAAFIERHGGTIRQGVTVKKITQSGTCWQLDVSGDGNTSRGEDDFDAVVVATQATHAANLLDGLVDTTSLTGFEYEPITTCYLQYGPGTRLTQALFALIDDPAAERWGQFVFDRGTLDPAHAGLLAVVISVSTDAIALGHDALADAVANQLSDVLQLPNLRHPKWTKVISEKRATFSCTPALVRPVNRTTCDGLVIAGDYTAGDYPATLESAIHSGVAAAHTLKY